MNSPAEIDSKQLLNRQDALLVQAERFFDGKRVPAKLAKAFVATPRHLFAQRFYSSKRGHWIDLSKESPSEHLDELYSDHPIGIFRNTNGKTLSTISQPTLVIFMLDLLQLKTGMNVFELGGGSGWNAAMIGRLVGSSGHVTSVEIIDSLATSARATIDSLNLPQVETIAGDASLGVFKNAPYQRGIFTASAWNLPQCFFDQIEGNGLLVFIMKIRLGMDLLTSLRKTGSNEFKSELHFTCSFVPVTGSQNHEKLEPIDFTNTGNLTEVSWEQIKISSTDIPEFISFVELIKDCQQPYLIEDPKIGYAEEFSGFSADNGDSIVLFNEDGIKNSGSENSLIELRRAAKRWQKASKPSFEDLDLSIYSADHAPESQNDQWLVRRENCIVCWKVGH